MINKTFVLSGKAIFTVNNDKGDHFTFRISRAEDKRQEGHYVYFASLLTGPNNLSDYTYMGIVNENDLLLYLTKKSKFYDDTASVRVFRWAMRVINGKTQLPNGYNIQHAGRCGRCAKALTDPVSIEIGIGPDCRKKMGITMEP